jgi:hypothetical protein
VVVTTCAGGDCSSGLYTQSQFRSQELEKKEIKQIGNRLMKQIACE